MTQAVESGIHKAQTGPFLPVALLAIGGYLAWFGAHYWRSDVKYPTDVIKAILQGKPLPSTARSDAALSVALTAAFTGGGTASTTDVSSGGSGGVGTLAGPNALIATAALKYQGAGYVFGGRADKPGDWDCSSFLSYVLGKDMGLTLPGGGTYGSPGYPPHAHGPVAAAYKLYASGINRSQVAAGDIVAWNTHCGIAIDGSHIISARTPSEGVGISTIDGTSSSIGETPVFRRVASSTVPKTSGGTTGGIVTL